MTRNEQEIVKGAIDFIDNHKDKIDKALEIAKLDNDYLEKARKVTIDKLFNSMDI